MFRRIFFFLITNILIVTTISIVLSIFNVQPYLNRWGIDYYQLAIFCLVWGFGGAFISLALSRVMAKWMMGVKVIRPDSTDAAEMWLVNLVHELARTAGLATMPQVGIYNAPELNAFATGPTRNRSLVAVSSGLLQRMDKTQVRGVLGHEITHIVNGDMVTLTLVQGVMNALVMFLARALAYAASQNVKENSRRMVYMITVISVQILLSFLAMFVVAYVSRAREYRADAGGADLAGRREMIAALQGLQAAASINAQVPQKGDESFAAFKISGRPGRFFSMLATHPPLEDRIARLQGGLL